MSRLNLTSYDFAKPHVSGANGYRFGLGSTKEAVVQLRRLADALEAGQVLLQKVETTTAASQEDFSETKLTLAFVEKE